MDTYMINIIMCLRTHLLFGATDITKVIAWVYVINVSKEFFSCTACTIPYSVALQIQAPFSPIEMLVLISTGSTSAPHMHA